MAATIDDRLQLIPGNSATPLPWKFEMVVPHSEPGLANPPLAMLKMA